MNFGFDYEIWNKAGIAVPINLDIKTYSNILISGSSGSGKSTALIYETLQILKEDVILYFCDFKNSDDFIFMKGYEHFYSGNATYDGIMAYYKEFSRSREMGEKLKRHVLIIDEYQAFITFLTSKDKTNKTKTATDILNAISELLMLGRGTGNGFGVWISVQRSDSNLFSSARDNFMGTIVLGHISKEQKQMAFSGEEIPEDRIYQRGEGLAYFDGTGLIEVKFPKITDLSTWKKNILKFFSSTEI